MSALDQVIEMKSQGFSDEEIVQKLREQGISAKEIGNALAQSNVKAAVSQNNSEPEPFDEYSSLPQQQSSEEQQYYNESPEQQEVQQQDFQQYQNYASQLSTDTITEITEQLINDKLDQIKKRINLLSELKTEFDTKLTDLDTRLSKIEETIDKIQMSIIGKIGEFSSDIKSINKEMQSTQESFSKALNPLTDLVHSLEDIAEKKK